MESIIEYYKNCTINELENCIKDLSEQYYTVGESIITKPEKMTITDKIFDQFQEILKSRNKKSKILTEVGFSSMNNKIKLPYPITSLNKLKTEQEIKKWSSKYTGPYVVSPKIDGVAGVYYKNKLYSRGDGKYGQDISHLLPYLKIDTKLEICIRGELYIEYEDFKRMNFTNIRSAVCSQLKSIDSEIASKIKFITHSIVYPRYEYSEQLKILEENKLETIQNTHLEKLDYHMLTEILLQYKKELKCDVDGIAVVDTRTTYLLDTNNPKFAFAFKMDLTEQTIEATVTDIIWELSKDGYIIPTIQIEPVQISNVTIKFVTGHNAKFIIDNKIGIDSIVKIIRSGDVIPKILETIKASNIKLPLIEYHWNETKIHFIADTKEHIDINIKNCVHFFTTLNIANINIGVVTKLAQKGYDTVIKILDGKQSELEEIIGEKNYKKIFTNMKNVIESKTLGDIMASSNVFTRGLGIKKLNMITEIYPDILSYTKEEMEEKINSIKGFDTKTTKKFIENVETFIKFYKKVKEIVKIEEKKEGKKEEKTEKMKNETIVFTQCRNKKYEEYIIENGGKVTGSVSSKTTLVIYGGGENSSKLNKALMLKIPIMSIEEFGTKYNI
jgi:DNA ligase (NAD+)